MECSKEALNISRKIGDVFSIAALQGNLGLHFNEIGRFREAVESHQESLKLSREIGNQSGVIAAYINLGKLYLDQGDRITPERHFLKALKMAQDTGERWLMPFAFFQIANFYILSEQRSDAEKMMQKAIESAEEIGMKSILLQGKTELHLLSSQREGNVPDMNRMEKLLDEARLIKDSDSILRLLDRMASTSIENKQPDKAISLSDEGKQRSDDRQHFFYRMKFNYLFAESLKLLGRYDDAFLSVSEAMNLIDPAWRNVEKRYIKSFPRQKVVRNCVELYITLAAETDKLCRLEKFAELINKSNIGSD